MKGVWKGRKVPLVMFHQSFHSFWEALEYDEPDLETYANIREAGFDKFSTDRRFDIDRIDDILKNVHKTAGFLSTTALREAMNSDASRKYSGSEREAGRAHAKRDTEKNITSA